MTTLKTRNCKKCNNTGLRGKFPCGCVYGEMILMDQSEERIIEESLKVVRETIERVSYIPEEEM